MNNKFALIVNTCPRQFKVLPIQHVYKVTNYHWVNSKNQLIDSININSLKLIFEQITYNLEEGHGTLIVSERGHSRAITFVLLYLMDKFGWELYKSLQYINSKRQNLTVRATYLKLLVQYQKTIRGQSPKNTTTLRNQQISHHIKSSSKQKWCVQQTRSEHEKLITNTFKNTIKKRHINDINLEYREKINKQIQTQKKRCLSINTRERNNLLMRDNNNRLNDNKKRGKSVQFSNQIQIISGQSLISHNFPQYQQLSSNNFEAQNVYNKQQKHLLHNTKKQLINNNYNNNNNKNSTISKAQQTTPTVQQTNNNHQLLSRKQLSSKSRLMNLHKIQQKNNQQYNKINQSQMMMIQLNSNDIYSQNEFIVEDQNQHQIMLIDDLQQSQQQQQSQQNAQLLSHHHEQNNQQYLPLDSFITNSKQKALNFQQQQQQQKQHKVNNQVNDHNLIITTKNNHNKSFKFGNITNNQNSYNNNNNNNLSLSSATNNNNSINKHKRLSSYKKLKATIIQKQIHNNNNHIDNNNNHIDNNINISISPLKRKQHKKHQRILTQPKYDLEIFHNNTNHNTLLSSTKFNNNNSKFMINNNNSDNSNINNRRLSSISQHGNNNIMRASYRENNNNNDQFLYENLDNKRKSLSSALGLKRKIDKMSVSSNIKQKRCTTPQQQQHMMMLGSRGVSQTLLINNQSIAKHNNSNIIVSRPLSRGKSNSVRVSKKMSPHHISQRRQQFKNANNNNLNNNQKNNSIFNVNINVNIGRLQMFSNMNNPNQYQQQQMMIDNNTNTKTTTLTNNNNNYKTNINKQKLFKNLSQLSNNNPKMSLINSINSRPRSNSTNQNYSKLTNHSYSNLSHYDNNANNKNTTDRYNNNKFIQKLTIKNTMNQRQSINGNNTFIKQFMNNHNNNKNISIFSINQFNIGSQCQSFTKQQIINKINKKLIHNNNNQSNNNNNSTNKHNIIKHHRNNFIQQ